MSETFDPEALIAALEARRAAYNAATDDVIKGLRVLGGLGTGLSTALNVPGANPTSVSQASTTAGVGNSDEYYGLSLVDAAKKYLRSVRRKLTNKEVAEGLEAVGYIHNSSNLANNVGTALWRAERDDDPELVRHGRYWLLTEWGIRKRPKKPSVEEHDVPTPEQIQAAEEIDEVKGLERELAREN